MAETPPGTEKRRAAFRRANRTMPRRRIDLTVDVPPVSASDLALPPPGEPSAAIAQRVAAARAVQRERLAALDRKGKLVTIEPDQVMDQEAAAQVALARE